MDLFEQRQQQLIADESPLAARMRPRSLDEFIGQSAIIGPGRLLRRAIQADQLSSVIFYGPPGTGKTTLARVIANSTKAHFIAINAVLGGVKDIRDAIDQAQRLRGQQGQRTLLFVDEVHRFNKAQQDALLPWVENGTVILIGATTENPFFEVNKALVSRSRIFQLKPLTAEDLADILQQALADKQRGYGHRAIQIDADAQAHLVNVANGDARSLLNALELAVETTSANEQGQIHITLPIAEESIQQRAVLYDKEGDAHFDIISAFIKSLRGSDPDAALYWLARMVHAGEDPRYLFRRMVILAGEDVGMADPQAMGVVMACAAAFDRVGMPEGRYPLAQAALYLATAPKSNSVMAFFDALAAVEKAPSGEVPNAMRDNSRDKVGFGHGAGYLYPHAYRDHWVAQQYLPSSLQGQVFYQPSDQGYEANIQIQVAQRREAQLAALMEEERTAQSVPEALSYGPMNKQEDRWLQRATGALGEQLGAVRDRIFSLLSPQRHHLLLDLNAGTGLLSWEALRRVPEGGVFSCVHQAKDFTGLLEQAAMLSELSRPQVVRVEDFNWQLALEDWERTNTTQATANLPNSLVPKETVVGRKGKVSLSESENTTFTLSFDGIIGRNALMALPDKVSAIQQLKRLLAPQGCLVLAESVPRRGQRLSALLNASEVPTALYKQIVAAEDELYNNPDDAMVNWDVDDLQQSFAQAGWGCELSVMTYASPWVVTPAWLERWLGEGGKYSDRLSAQGLSAKQREGVRSHFSRQLSQQTVNWHRSVVFVRAAHRL
jgi:putative ATPase